MNMSKDTLKKVALLLISESPYVVDDNALIEYMNDNGFEDEYELRAYLKSELGDEYPTVLPSSFIYGEGL